MKGKISAPWNFVFALLVIGGGFVFGTYLWSRADPVQYNEWASRYGLPVAVVTLTPDPAPTVEPTQPTATPTPVETIATPFFPEPTPVEEERECSVSISIMRGTTGFSGTLKCGERLHFNADTGFHSVIVSAKDAVVLVINGGVVRNFNPQLESRLYDCPEMWQFAEIDQCIALDPGEQVELSIVMVTNFGLQRQ